MTHVSIIYDSGGVGIMQIAGSASDEAIERAIRQANESWRKLGFGSKSWRRVSPEDVPTDTSFRNAWSDDGEKIGVDMPKARDIHMARIRAARDKKLAALDIEQLKGNDVATEKQALRDLPATFDLSKATTPEALKALWPAGV